MIDEQQLSQLNIKRGVKKRFKKSSVLIAACIIVLVTVFGCVLAWRTWYFYKLVKTGADAQLARAVGFTTNPRARNSVVSSVGANQLVRLGAPEFGASKSNITVIQFADFECPFSRGTHGTIRELMATHAKDMRFIFRHFPIAELHPHALKASEAASCANDQGKFWAYYDKLFQNQTQLDDADLKRYAKEAGVKSDVFDACLDGGIHYKEVIQDYQDGLRAGVRGTPTFFVNGQKVEGVISLAEWEKVLAYFK